MLSEEEYKQEWLNGKHQNEYNSCRFAEDKVAYGRDWLLRKIPNLNLDEPKTLIDRIAHGKLYDLNPDKAIWADKINVSYLAPQELVIPTVAFSRSALTKSMYDALPNGKYIVKCNHGSGWNLKFEKTNTSNPDFLIKQTEEWYSLNYAYIAGWEWQYDQIVRGVIIQPDLGDGLMDWSFWCENGEIEYIGLTSKLAKNIERYIAFTDANGNKSNFIIGMKPEMESLPKSFKDIIQKMKPYVLELSKGFKFVRVDLLYINNEIKLSELTFTPCAGVIV